MAFTYLRAKKNRYASSTVSHSHYVALIVSFFLRECVLTCFGCLRSMVYTLQSTQAPHTSHNSATNCIQWNCMPNHIFCFPLALDRGSVCWQSAVHNCLSVTISFDCTIRLNHLRMNRINFRLHNSGVRGFEYNDCPPIGTDWIFSIISLRRKIAVVFDVPFAVVLWMRRSAFAAENDAQTCDAKRRVKTIHSLALRRQNMKIVYFSFSEFARQPNRPTDWLFLEALYFFMKYIHFPRTPILFDSLFCRASTMWK